LSPGENVCRSPLPAFAMYRNSKSVYAWFGCKIDLKVEL
jgi:hypothetical protein